MAGRALAGGSANSPGVLEGMLAGLDHGWQARDPATGSAIAGGVSVHHDAGRQNVLMHRSRVGLTLSVYQFDGSYLSLAIDVPGPVRARLRPGWRLNVGLVASASRPVTTFLRLNLDGHRGSQALHEVLVVEKGPRSAAFGLDAAGDGWSSAWVDIIFSHPRMVEIGIEGLTMAFDEGP